MGQHSKTLSAVVLGAAVAGWLMVRMLTSAPPAPESPTTRVASAPSAIPAAAATVPVEPTASPANPRPSAAPASTLDGGAGDAAVIARELEVLLQALVRDQRIEDRLMPRIDDALDVPGVTSYRRAPDFWEPALASSEGANR